MHGAACLHFSPPDGRSTRYDIQDFVALACRAQRTVRVRLCAPSGSRLFPPPGLRLVLTALSRTSPRRVVRHAGLALEDVLCPSLRQNSQCRTRAWAALLHGGRRCKKEQAEKPSHRSVKGFPACLRIYQPVAKVTQAALRAGADEIMPGRSRNTALHPLCRWPVAARNPLGDGRLRPSALSFVGGDHPDRHPPHFAPSDRRSPPRLPRDFYHGLLWIGGS